MGGDNRIESLASIESALWLELGRAAHEADHDWRTMSLATVDGERADARLVVLRETDAEARTLLFYTDARSPKLEQLRRWPAATLLLWSRALSWQLRIRATLRVETSGLAVSSRWARLKLTPAAHDYLSPLAPGATLPRPAPERGTREHFALVFAEVGAIDWLELHAEGQRRAAFDAAGARWLQP